MSLRSGLVALVGFLGAALPGATPSGAQQSAAAPLAYRAPADSEIPNDDVGASIRRGLALMLATRDSLPANVGSALRCVSCHPDAGRRPDGSPWLGVYARFPQYRARSGHVDVIEDRINDCFLRSMNGRPLPREGRDMRDIVSYMAFLSRGVPVGATIVGQGLPKVAPVATDTARGAEVLRTVCARCHGADGQGTAAAPPLWGARSFTIGAGMARLRTAAAFIRYNMPYDRPGSLSDQEAYDVAAYIVSRPRPDFHGKEHDWPRGDPPADAAYPTLRAQPHTH